MEEKCIVMGAGECDGVVKIRDIFSNQLRIPICERHFKEHYKTMEYYKKVCEDAGI